MLKDSRAGYGLVTIILHWVCAPLILFLFGLGVYMRGLDYYSPWYHRGPELHIALGLLVFGLMSLRLLWRSRSTDPVFVISISGYFITTAEGQGASFFGLFSIPATVEFSASNIDFAGAIHKYFAWGVIGIVLLHAGAAIFHHFVKRDATLVRMLKPATKADPISSTD